MKYLLVLAVVAVAFWIWRGKRRERIRAQQAHQAPHQAAAPQSMLRCARCGLHLPAAEALPGRRGHYCSAAHRQASEG